MPSLKHNVASLVLAGPAMGAQRGLGAREWGKASAGIWRGIDRQQWVFEHCLCGHVPRCADAMVENLLEPQEDESWGLLYGPGPNTTSSLQQIRTMITLRQKISELPGEGHRVLQLPMAAKQAASFSMHTVMASNRSCCARIRKRKGGGRRMLPEEGDTVLC